MTNLPRPITYVCPDCGATPQGDAVVDDDLVDAEVVGFALQAREALWNGLIERVEVSVARRAPFLSVEASKALVEDVTENIAAFLHQVFDM